MSYVVLARKWRPAHFRDLIGQEHVARTLANAIARNRVAHAFLFTGVRGVGKTTSARILAKALNCMGNPETTAPSEDPGPTSDPCLKCSACQEIAAGTNIDVREIDGASYNGVDEVRKLQDSLPYRPSRDRYKIFIVDEVHMLSQNAWNAFLKTLEEPPPHVKFIFATTEAHRVPITILSRVQRFDFRLISTRLIAERLRHVLTSEGFDSDEAATSIIAREAMGSMRDAMSLLEQVLAWSEDTLKGPDVARVLGVATQQTLFELVGALLNGDAQAGLDLIASLSDQGYDMVHVARDTLSLLRDLIVARVCSKPDQLLDMPDEEKEAVVSVSKNHAKEELIRIHQGFSKSYDEVARSGQPRAALEMLLIRLSMRPPLIPVTDILSRLTALEARLRSSGGRTSPPSAHQPSNVQRAAAPPSKPQSEAHRPPQTRPGAAQQTARNMAPLSSAKHPGATASQGARERHGGSRDAQPSRASNTPKIENDDPGGVSKSPLIKKTPPPEAPPPRSPPELQGLLPSWTAILAGLQDTRPELAAFLERAIPLELDSGVHKVGWRTQDDVFAKEASSKAAVDLISQTATAHFGNATRIEFQLDCPAADAASSLAQLRQDGEKRARQAAIHRAKNHPRVVDALELFSGRIRDIRLPDN